MVQDVELYGAYALMKCVNTRNFLISQITIDFLRKTVYHGVSESVT